MSTRKLSGIVATVFEDGIPEGLVIVMHYSNGFSAEDGWISCDQRIRVHNTEVYIGKEYLNDGDTIDLLSTPVVTNHYARMMGNIYGESLGEVLEKALEDALDESIPGWQYKSFGVGIATIGFDPDQIVVEHTTYVVSSTTKTLEYKDPEVEEYEEVEDEVQEDPRIEGYSEGELR